jgi:predicted porin
MKKSLIAFAVLSAFASAASAQSSVVLYGIIDASTSYTTSQTTTGGKKFSLDASNLLPSRWGVKGTEYLDGGLKANFRLESTLNVDTGTAGALFDRNATVGLSGDFGSVDAGRQDNLAFSALAAVDPMGVAHVATNPNVAFGSMNNAGLYSAHGASNGATSALRQNNSVKYTAPAVLGGIVFTGMYAFGEKAGDATASSYAGATASYSEGGLTAIFTYAQLKDAANATTLRSYTGGAKFVLDNTWTLKVTYSDNEVNTTGRDISVFGAGVDYMMSPTTTLTGAYYANRRSGDTKAKADQFVGIAKYAFSKRTTAYTSASYAKAGTKLAADTDLGLFIGAGNRTATRLTVGVLHSF